MSELAFHPTEVDGAFRLVPEKLADERGFFARTFSVASFRERGLTVPDVQFSISFNHKRGTLRGMHYQAAPYAETKLVRCTRGRVFDVALDLRPTSPTYLLWTAAELTADNHVALYIPAGCAHGFITLEDQCELLYQITPAFEPQSARGVRFDDPAFGIVWPIDATVISARDKSYPDYRPER
jgi:dTDP-4-dehydrorhamnose 3,5-epimerase